MVARSNTTAKKSARSLRGLGLVICGLLLALLLSCSQYEFTLNDNTLYDPHAFRNGLLIADTTLLECTKQIVTEQQITKASQLRQLICGPGEIKVLDGLEVFNKLVHLGLPNNRIENITSLRHLGTLQQINLANNRIRDASSLAELSELNFLDLSGNSELLCASIEPLINKQVEVKLPEHCHR